MIPTLRARLHRNNAIFFDQAGNRVSGLDLSEIGEDGHAVANLLWKISAYYARKAGSEEVRYPRPASECSAPKPVTPGGGNRQGTRG